MALCRSLSLLLLTLTTSVADQPDYVPKLGEFPPADAGVYLAGELVQIDHVNRRGALRLLGDGMEDRYHAAPSFAFALLPYAIARYHDAPAELKDIPLGTVLHGRFVLPPAGDTTIAPPDKSKEKYVPKHNHALMLEDSVSFYKRHGQAWKISAIDLKNGALNVSVAGGPAPDGLKSERVFDIGPSTRIWRGKQIGSLDDLAANQTVQVNLTWAPDWVNTRCHASDIWLDEESVNVAREQQRQIHLRYEQVHGLPAWIDHVDHQPGGKGVVTLTVFGGRDQSLYDQIKKGHGLRIAAAEPTLRTWWGDHDYKYGQIQELVLLDPPPFGSNGIQLQLTINELLEGFRPGRIVRIFPSHWPRIKLPPEERVKGMDDR